MWGLPGVDLMYAMPGYGKVWGLPGVLQTSIVRTQVLLAATG